jgi:hypothetical protein
LSEQLHTAIAEAMKGGRRRTEDELISFLMSKPTVRGLLDQQDSQAHTDLRTAIAAMVKRGAIRQARITVHYTP